MSQKMFINYVHGEECRIAVVRDGKLEELYHERASSESHVGSIYQGRVVNVEPGIQAAFVDFGLERNGFLHVTDLHPKFFPGDAREEFERVGKKTPHRERPPIQRCLKPRQEITVQVLKEGIGTKGPTLTSYLSIPGRFLVMMPDMERMGVSRKVEDDDARREMRKILDELTPPEGYGFIVRTAGIGRTKADIKRDLAYLQRLWKNLEKRKKTTKIGELYTESDLIIRTIRDVFTSDIDQIIVDDARAAKRARDFLTVFNPRSGSKVSYYADLIPMFHRYGIEEQIEHINAREVPLPSGGSLVIDSTEALVAIDVNSGRMRDHRDAETTAFKTNMEAADEICRQLRLRDLGGVIVNDLIDMRDLKNRKKVEARFKDNLKSDRARTRLQAISQFGILEMTRQRMRPSLKNSIYVTCQHCQGAGQVKSGESVVLDVMRRLACVMYDDRVARIDLTVSPDVAFYLLNRKRSQMVALERRSGKPVLVRVSGSGPIDFVQLAAFDARGGAVDTDQPRNLPEPTLAPADEADLAFDEQDDEAVLAGLDGDADVETEAGSDSDDDGSDVDDDDGDDEPSGRSDGQAGHRDDQDGPSQGKRRRRRRRRRGDRGPSDTGGSDPDRPGVDRARHDDDGDGNANQGRGQDAADGEDESSEEEVDRSEGNDETRGRDASDDGEPRTGRRRRRRRGGRGRRRASDDSRPAAPDGGDGDSSADESRRDQPADPARQADEANEIGDVDDDAPQQAEATASTTHRDWEQTSQSRSADAESAAGGNTDAEDQTGEVVTVDADAPASDEDEISSDDEPRRRRRRRGGRRRNKRSGESQAEQSDLDTDVRADDDAPEEMTSEVSGSDADVSASEADTDVAGEREDDVSANAMLDPTISIEPGESEPTPTSSGWDSLNDDVDPITVGEELQPFGPISEPPEVDGNRRDLDVSTPDKAPGADSKPPAPKRRRRSRAKSTDASKSQGSTRRTSNRRSSGTKAVGDGARDQAGSRGGTPSSREGDSAENSKADRETRAIETDSYSNDLRDSNPKPS